MPTSPGVSLGERTILAAEDDPFWERLLKHRLERLRQAGQIAGFEIFPTGEALLAEVEKRSGRESLLVITDFQLLGRLSGAEVAYKLLGFEPAIPLTVITGSREDEVLEAWAGVAGTTDPPPRIISKEQFANNIPAMLQSLLLES